MQRIQSPPLEPGTGKAVRLRYLTQVGSAPPRFALFVNRGAGSFPEHYRRFLVRQLRGAFKLKGVPITIEVQNRQAKEGFTKYRSAPQSRPMSQRSKGRGTERKRGGPRGGVTKGKGSAFASQGRATRAGGRSKRS